MSVVIPARNEAAGIERAIAPFLVDAPGLDVEVIVADGGSTDATRDVVLGLAARDPRVKLVDNPRELIPEGLNAAIQASTGDVIVRMDGHAEPADDYLASCLAALDESAAWNVGGRMIKTGETSAARAAAAAATSAFGIGGGLRHHLATKPADLTSVWLGCWPRWVFERVGLFDPEMAINEDEELNRRILEAGGTVRFDPSIRAVYLSRAFWRGTFKQYFRYGIYRVRAVQKHPRMLRLRHLVPAGLVAMLVIASLMAVVLFPVGAMVGAALVLLWLTGAVLSARGAAKDHASTVPTVVLAYACMHLGYGIGMWTGIVRFAPRWLHNRRGRVPALQGDRPGG